MSDKKLKAGKAMIYVLVFIAWNIGTPIRLKTFNLPTCYFEFMY